MHTCHNHTCHNPLHCFLPPHIIDHLVTAEDPEIRNIAVENIAVAAAVRSVRTTLATMPMMSAIPSPARTKHRLVYDMEQKRETIFLPGKLVRSEGDPPVEDDAVNEAYDYSGTTYDFYKEIFDRNSLDNKGMELISSVHFGRNTNNAFFTGEQMLYGDGDGRIFLSFTKALDVVAHELTHGVIMQESNLEYKNESGALNEHFADVMSALVKQWHLKQTVEEANWLMGDALMAPNFPVKSIRTFKAEKAYEDVPNFGTDPQPKHLRDKYTGSDDNGGVHINSGIPNHAFYLVAMELGGKSWEKAGSIWYKTLRAVSHDSNFQEAAKTTYIIAGGDFGNNSIEQQAVKNAWDAVGITI